MLCPERLPPTHEHQPLTENKIYVANLEGGKKHLPPGVSACPDIWLGTIMGERVAVVTTGGRLCFG